MGVDQSPPQTLKPQTNSQKLPEKYSKDNSYQSKPHIPILEPQSPTPHHYSQSPKSLNPNTTAHHYSPYLHPISTTTLTPTSNFTIKPKQHQQLKTRPPSQLHGCKRKTPKKILTMAITATALVSLASSQQPLAMANPVSTSRMFTHQSKSDHSIVAYRLVSNLLGSYSYEYY